jgi:trans-aconitate 2-methyltransferase
MLYPMGSQDWDPEQYRRFAAERRRPFDDLLRLLAPVPGGRVVDLGCGPGELTIELHRHVDAAETIGVDSSPAMIADARRRLEDVPTPGVTFELGTIEAWQPRDPFDVVFANASLHWVPDHDALLPRLIGALASDGQLAFQVPATHDHPSHTLARELGDDWGLVTRGGAVTVLAPEHYAEILHRSGLVDIDVRLQVYGFELPSGADVAEWTKGTLLTGYRAQLDEPAYDEFEHEYRERLTASLGAGPYYYAFKRILAYARRS